MADSSEGVRRLSLFAGGIGSLLWLAYIWEEGGFSPHHPVHWLILIGGSVGFFLVGFALVRAVTRVIQGFTRK